MPGNSLWLVPAKESPIYATLEKLITTTIPSYLSAKTNLPVSSFPSFTPHVTLYSGVNQNESNPQAWLERYSISELNPPVKVELQKLESRPIWNMKLYVSVKKDESLIRLARNVGMSEEQIEKWYPHTSLAYNGDVGIDQSMLDDVQSMLDNAGVSLAGQEEGGGWISGRVAVVETLGKIEQWKELASVTLSSNSL